MYAPETFVKTTGNKRTTLTLHIMAAHVTETIEETIEVLNNNGDVVDTQNKMIRGTDIVEKFGHMNPMLIGMGLTGFKKV